MTVPDPHCTDCMPWDGTSVADCQLLDDFSNRSTDPDIVSPLGWSVASYIYTSGDHLAWTANHPELSWVDSGRGLIRMPAASSLTVTVTTQAPTAYGTLVSTTTGSGYWYTVDFWAGPMPATTMFRLRDANGEVIVTMGTGAVTAQRFGSAAGTYAGSTTFLDDQFDNPYTLIMYIDPTVTRVEIKQGATTMLSSVTSVATNPILAKTTDPSISLIGTGGAEPGYTMRFERIELAPCERPLAEANFWHGFQGDRTLEASAMGGPASIVAGPTYTSSGNLIALWDGYDQPGASQGNRELERRAWLTWLVPPGTQYVRLVGTRIALQLTLDTETRGRPQNWTVDYQLGPVVFDPDTGPTDYDNTGSGMNGTVAYSSEEPQVSDTLDVTSSSIGASYNAGDGIAWHRFQLALKDSSTAGIGRHTYLASSHADGSYIETLNRFPNNPNWLRPPNPVVDYSEVQSGISLTVDTWAFGINGGTGTVVPPRTNQPVQDEFIGTGDGSTQAFTTRFPYTNLSLEIEVDGVKVGVEETGATTGAFTLAFAPAFGEQIYATYRARG